jgi:hypothetical protein
MPLKRTEEFKEAKIIKKYKLYFYPSSKTRQDDYQW